MMCFRLFLMLTFFLGTAQEIRILALGGAQQCWTKSTNANYNFILPEFSTLEYRPLTSYSGLGACLLQMQFKKYKRLFAEYGLQFSAHTQNYEISNPAGFYNVGRIRLNYLKFPLCIQYQLLHLRYFHMYAGVGPQPAILLAERGGIPVNTNFIDAGSFYKNATMGATASVTGDIIIAGIHFTGRMGFEGTFTNVEKGISYDFEFPLGTIPQGVLKHEPNHRNYNWYGLIGLSFNVDRGTKE